MIVLLALVCNSCQPVETEIDQTLTKAYISYSFVQKYSNDSTLINTVFNDYLDSLHILPSQFETFCNRLDNDIQFRSRVMSSLVPLLDSADVINSQYLLYKKIHALQNDSLSSYF